MSHNQRISLARLARILRSHKMHNADVRLEIARKAEILASGGIPVK